MSSALKAAVSQAIAERRPDAAARFNEACSIPEGVEDVVAIDILNRYWRTQLESVNADTTGIREYLVSARTCNAADWLRLFHTGVLPAILAYGLPQGT